MHVLRQDYIDSLSDIATRCQKLGWQFTFQQQRFTACAEQFRKYCTYKQ